MRKKKIIPGLAGGLSLICAKALPVYAAESAAVAGKEGKGFSQLNKFFKTIKPWVNYISMIILLVGIVMFFLAWTNDSAESKSRALLVIAAGGIIQAVIGIVSVANMVW